MDILFALSSGMLLVLDSDTAHLNKIDARASAQEIDAWKSHMLSPTGQP